MHESIIASPTADLQTDTFPIHGTDFVEFYVGNARQAAHYYCHAFGFKWVGYRGPETGYREAASYVLVQDKIRFVLTTPLSSDTDVAEHVHRHGDGVKDVAFWVEDARTAFAQAVENGAVPAYEPYELKDEHGSVVLAAIKTYGDTIHSLVERKNYSGIFLPGFVAQTYSHWKPQSIGLKYVDHVVGNVDLGDMNRYAEFYANVLGFRQLVSFDDEDISTEYTALMSKVMSNGNERIKLPINEPADGKKKSQIEEFLDFYHGAGVQHLALATDDILKAVTAMRQSGVDFLQVPETYYDVLRERVGEIDEPIDELRDLGILVDRDEDGYLLQIFSRPVEDRPTLFYEIIQRKGARSFGKGNFKALFEALEREQGMRGNL